MDDKETIVDTSHLRFQKRSDFADGAGGMYEMKMTALLFVRALNLTDEFYLASNMSDAGAFDDIVFSYKHDGSTQFKTCFLQLKHKKGKKGVTLRDLMTVKAKRDDFSLLKYCKSYNEIRQKFDDSSDGNSIFMGKFENFEIIIYTNANIDQTLSKRKRENHSNSCHSHSVLNSCTDNVFAFKFSSECDSDVYKYFQDLEECKKCLNDIKTKKLSGAEQQDRINECKTNIKKDISELLESSVRRNEADKFSKEIGDISHYNNFLGNIQFFFKQASEEQLDTIVEKEIQQFFGTPESESRTICKELFECVLQWWKCEDYYLTNKTQFWQEIVDNRKNRVIHLNEAKCNEMQRLGVKFQEKHVFSLQECGIINIVTDTTLLSCLKVHQMLKIPHLVIGLRSLLLQKREVLSLWPSMWCTTLVVDWESDHHVCDDLWIQLQEAMQPRHRLIVLSNKPLGGEYTNHTIHAITDHSLLRDLDEISQQRIGDKEATFQGFPLPLKFILSHNKTTVIDENLIMEILTKEIHIGRDVTFSSDLFISRSLHHHVHIKEEILRRHDFSAVLAVSGISEEYCKHACITDKIYRMQYDSEKQCQFVAVDILDFEINLEYTCFQNTTRKKALDYPDVDLTNCQFVMIRGSDDFKVLYENYRNVHWLEMQEQNKLLWRGSVGKMDDIKLYIEEEENICYSQDQIPKISDNVVLVTAEPGMGKSTLVSQLSSQMKVMNVAKWVIPINLSDYSQLLDTVEETTSLSPSVIQFLTTAACASNSDLEKKLFISALDHMNEIIILFDAVDEISSTCTRKVCSIMKTLRRMKVCQLWVTSRPVMRNFLENELCVLSHVLQPFTMADQLSFAVNFWTTRNQTIDTGTAKKFAIKLFQATTKGIKDFESQFMGIPLQSKMIAEIYQNHLETFKEMESFNLPDKVNLLELYRQFVKLKSDVYFKDKWKVDVTKAGFQRDSELLYREFQEIHMVCSLYVMFSESDLLSLKPENIIQNSKDIIRDIQKGSDNRGIIDKVESGVPHFIHRSFAEYFCAMWFRKYYALNTSFLREKLQDPNLDTIWKMLNYMLSENNELHLSALNGDVEHIRLILKGTDVNKKDKCSRSALHVASICNNRAVAEELLESGADITLTDSLGWSPLDYCDRTRSWATADLLLHYINKDSSTTWNVFRNLWADNTLMVTKQKITDPLYGIQAFAKSAEEGYMELTKFLLSNGLDVDTKLNNANQTALHIAVKHNQLSIIKLLIQHKADVTLSDEYGCTALHRASENGNKDVVECLLDTVNNTDIKDKKGRLPFWYACLNGHLSVVQYFLQHNLDINTADNNGDTPLIMATLQNHLPVIQYLLQHGAEVDMKNDCGYTALHVAAQKGHLTVTQNLLQCGAQVDISDRCSALHVAALKGHLSVVQYLMSHGARDDKLDNESTALHVAALKGHLSVVQHLVATGTRVNTANNIGNTPIHAAVIGGDISVVQYLLQCDSNVDVANNNGFTPLILAAQKGNLSVVENLLQHGAEIDKSNINGSTALHMAVLEGYLPVIECLLRHGAEVDKGSCDGFSSLHISAQEGHLPLVQYLIQSGARVDLANSEEYGITPLILAAQNGHLFLVQYLLKCRADVNLADTNGFTAIHVAAMQGHLHIIELLLQCKANIDAVNADGFPPIQLAAMSGHLHVVQHLLQSGAKIDVTNNDGFTVVHVAARQGHVSIVHYLFTNIQNASILESVNNEGNTALHVAAMEGHLHIVLYLLQSGIKFDKRNINGFTALHLASVQGHEFIVQNLIKFGAEVEHKTDDFGITPLLLAALKGHLSIVQCLLQNGAGFDVCSNNGNTPLYMAAQEGHISVVEHLSQCGAEIDRTNRNGFSPLHAAAKNGHTSVVKFLLQCGAQTNTKNIDGNTPLMLAESEGHLVTAQLFQENSLC